MAVTTGRTAVAEPSGRTPGRRHPVVAVVVGVGALLVCLVASLAIGSQSVPVGQVWSSLTAPTGLEGEIIVRSLRVPRTLLGLTVGAALGMAGAVIQGHTRNPLADPGLLGVTAGAALAVVTGISVAGVQSLDGYVWLAFLGAFATSVLVFALGTVSAGRAGATPVTLALIGVAVSALLTGVTTGLLLLDAATLDAYRFWVVGSLAGRGTGVLVAVAPFLALGTVLAASHGRALNALGLGDDVARGLGISVGRARLLGILAITLLVGAATAACGPIAFVGLVVPHVARMLTGPDHRWLVPASALFGAVLLLAADVVGRVAAPPGELQVGIALAVVGAPFFIALIRRRRPVGL